MEIPEFLVPISETFDELAMKYGALGIFLAMLAESAGVPFASAFVILTAGQMIVTGKVSFIGAILASTIGITIGSIISYFIGYWGQKVGKILSTTVLNGKVEKTPYQQTKLNYYFEKYGSFSVVMAQLIGTTRTFVSFPAGAMHMKFMVFLGYTALGGVIFSLLAIVASIILSRIISYFFWLLGTLKDLPLWVWPILIAAIVFFSLKGYRYYQKKTLEKKNLSN